MSGEKTPIAPVAVGVVAVMAYGVGGTAGVLVTAALAGVVFTQRARLESLLRRLPVRSGRRYSSAGEAGASSFARARALRTPWVRLLTAVGIITRAERQARRCVAGGTGERMAAKWLRPLLADGWVFLYDRRFPFGKANVDILAISPSGTVYNLDPKMWSARYRLYVLAGRLFHGNRDVTDRLNGIRYETRTINSLLSVQAISVVLMIGPLAPGEQLRVAGVRIIPAADAVDVLRALDREQIPHPRGPHFLDLAARRLPSYTGK